MRILHLHWGFPPIIGGVETHLAMMLPVMARCKNSVALLTGSVEGTKLQYRYQGVSIYRTPLMDLNWLYKRGLFGLDADIEKLFRKIIDKEKPAVIHAHNMHYFSSIHAVTLRDITRSKGIPLVLTAHNVWDDMQFLDLTLNIPWDHIIAVSHFIKRELLGIGCENSKITVIHHGTDVKQYHPAINTQHIMKRFPALKNKRIIFHPARMGLAKGCDVSIKALRIVKRKFPDALLVLAGTKNIIDWGSTQQKDIAYLVGLMKTMKLEPNMLINVFSMEEIAQLYALSQVCLYPSTAPEPFGLTMLEALSTARPMIVTDSGGMPEIIQEGINGYIISVKDFESLAMRIIQLLDNESLRKRLGATGRSIIKSRYTKEHMTDNVLHLYKNLP